MLLSTAKSMAQTCVGKHAAKSDQSWVCCSCIYWNAEPLHGDNAFAVSTTLCLKSQENYGEAHCHEA